MPSPRRAMMGASGVSSGGPPYKFYTVGADADSRGTQAQSSTAVLTSPVQVGSGEDWVQASGQYGGAMATKSDGSLWGWGRIYGYDFSGNPSPNFYTSSPVQMVFNPSSLNDDDIWVNDDMDNYPTGQGVGDTGQAITKTGQLWMWNRNYEGQLPSSGASSLNAVSPLTAASRCGDLSDWHMGVWGGYAGSAIKTDGTLWSFGNSTSGEMGLGSDFNTSRSTVQVGSDTDWAWICGGSNCMFAIKTNGTLWSTGENSHASQTWKNGQLGHGDTTNRSTLAQVGALTTWKYVTSGGGCTAAIKTDGTLWVWGGNTAFGQLGVGNTTQYSSPVQVGSLTDWKYAGIHGQQGASMAIKTDGTLWVWGKNECSNGTTYNGILGNGSVTRDISSPVQITSPSEYWDSMGNFRFGYGTLLANP